MDTETSNSTQLSNIHIIDLEALKLAAFKAQEAATRCERQPSDLRRTRKPSLPLEPTNQSNLGSSPAWVEPNNALPVNTPVIGERIVEGPKLEKTEKAQIEEDLIDETKHHNRVEAQQHSLLGSDPVPSDEVPGDSGLGESLSDTDWSARRASPTGISFLSNPNDVTAHNTRTENTNNWEQENVSPRPGREAKLTTPTLTSPSSRSSMATDSETTKNSQLLTEDVKSILARSSLEQSYLPSLVLIFTTRTLVRKGIPRLVLNIKPPVATHPRTLQIMKNFQLLLTEDVKSFLAQLCVEPLYRPSLVLIFTTGISVRKGIPRLVPDIEPPIIVSQESAVPKKRGRPRKVVAEDGQCSKIKVDHCAPSIKSKRLAAKRGNPGNPRNVATNDGIHDEHLKRRNALKSRYKRSLASTPSMPVWNQSIRAPNARRSRTDDLEIGYPNRSIAHHENDLKLSPANDASFKEAFYRKIFPLIQAVAQYYKDTLPNETLFSFGKQVTDEIVSKDFQIRMRECSYELSKEEIKSLHTFIITSFSRRVSLATLNRETLTSGRKPNSVNSNLPPNCSRSLPSQTLSSAFVSDDLSLLGPGKMVQSGAPMTLDPKSLLENQFSSDQLRTHRVEKNFDDLSMAPVPSKPQKEINQNSNYESGDYGTGVLSRRNSVKSTTFPTGSYRASKNLGTTSQHSTKDYSGIGASMKSSKNFRVPSNLQSTSLAPNSIVNHQNKGTSGLIMKVKQESSNLIIETDNRAKGQVSADVKCEQGKGGVNPLQQASMPSVKTNFHANREGSSNAEDDEEFLAGWFPTRQEKSRSSKVQNLTPLSSDVLDPDIPISSSRPISPKREQMDVTFHQTQTSTVKSKLSLATSASVAQSSDELDFLYDSLEEDSKSQDGNLPPQQTDDMDVEVEENLYELDPDTVMSQNGLTKRRSRRISSQQDSFRTAISKGKTSIASEPQLEKYLCDLATNSPYVKKPYNKKDRNIIKPVDGHGAIKHVDFSDEECEEILEAFNALFSLTPSPATNSKARDQLHTSVRALSYDDVSDLIMHIHSNSQSILQCRKRKSIRAFLSDIADSVPDRPIVTRVEAKVIDPNYKPQRSVASLLHNRELGLDCRGSRIIKSELRTKISHNISPWRSWKGASGDIVACAWAPDSSNYALGAAALDNDEDLQYNRPRNLLYGNLNANTLHELPDHQVDRPKPEMIASGPNSTQAVYDACDPVIYKTVSSLQFSQDGCQLYTASHDMRVKIWDITSSGASCVETLDHDSIVTDLDVCQKYQDVFATASKSIDGAVRVYHRPDNSDSDQFSCMNFASPRAKEKPQWELFPGCVKWGKTPNTAHMLLAGFMQWGDLVGDSSREGHICLWNVETGSNSKVSPGTQSVFTAAWHPLCDMFATGGGSSRVRPLSYRSTKSVVRVWDIRTTGLARDAIEFECPALDMQDITFNPLHSSIVTAGCTDSATYVWDSRKPEKTLLKLEHGRPLSDWDHNKSQEEGDTGVMMTLWGAEGYRFYTGSSDGIVKCWDTSRAPEDAFIRDIADLGAGVQSGAFSPDFSHLLVGDADGGAHILTSAPVDGGYDASSYDSIHATQPIHFVNACEMKSADDDPGTEGILAARCLLESGELVLNKKYGVGKGPNYRGPYARYARPKDMNLTVPCLLHVFEAMQPFSQYGYERPDIASRIEGIIKERKHNISMKQKYEKDKPNREMNEHAARMKKRRAKKEKRDTVTTEAKPFVSSAKSSNKRSHSQDETIIPSKKPKWEIIDLSSPPYEPFTPSPRPAPHTTINTVFHASSRENPIALDSGSEIEVEDNIIPEWEMLEEDHWWPRWDEEVFRKLGVRG